MSDEYFEQMKREGNLVPCCEYLELRLPQVEMEGVAPYLAGERSGKKNSDALWEFVRNAGEPLLRKFIPYCARRRSLCVVMESPVIAMQNYGGLYQHLQITVMNSNRIEGCKDRKIPESRMGMGGVYRLDEFILRGIALAVANAQKSKPERARQQEERPNPAGGGSV